MSMIEAEFHLMEEQAEVLLEPAVVELQPPFGKAPEVLNSVDMRLADSEGVLVVNPSVIKTFQMQAAIRRPLVGINHRLRLDVGLDGPVQTAAIHRLRKDHAHLSAALQQAKYRHFAAGAASPFAFAMSAKVALIHFHLAGELAQLGQCLALDRLPQKGVVTQNRLASKRQIRRRSGCRHQQPEQADQFTHLRRRQTAGPRPGCELPPAATAHPPAIGQTITTAVTASRTKNMTRNSCHNAAGSFVTCEITTQHCIHRTSKLVAWSGLAD